MRPGRGGGGAHPHEGGAAGRGRDTSREVGTPTTQGGREGNHPHESEAAGSGRDTSREVGTPSTQGGRERGGHPHEG